MAAREGLQSPETPTAQQARAVLHALIARLSDADALALWRLIASWYPAVAHDREERTDGP
jgi:hypothetical protein